MTFFAKIHQILSVDTKANKIIKPPVFADTNFIHSLASIPQTKPDTAKIVRPMHPKKQPG
jgi:hypothetical protein